MKLAEALVYRKETLTKIQQLSQRLEDNATYQEGSATAEDPMELLEELEGAISTLEDFVSRINETNVNSVYDGRSIADMIAERDAKTKHVGILRKFLSSASSLQSRYSRDEILRHSSVDVQKLRKVVDEKSKYIRQLDLKIQELNWQTELL